MALAYAISLQAVLAAWRDPRQGARVHASVTATVAFTVGSAFLAWFLYLYDTELGYPFMIRAEKHLFYTSLVMIAVGVAFTVWTLLRRHKRDVPVVPRHKTPVSTRIKFAFDLASPGWKQLEAPSYIKEDHSGASRSARAMVVGTSLVVFPSVVFLLAATILMNIRGSAASDFAAHVVGYYVLLLSTAWTVIFLATLLLVGVQQSLRGEDAQKTLSLSDVVLSVGTWAGFGAAGGVFVGALIPAVVILIPSGPFESLDVTLLDSITPGLLLSTSAAGAILGFLLGEVISLVSYAENEENLLIKIIFPPMLFGVLASAFGYLGLRPGAISKKLADLYKATNKGSSTKTDGLDPFAMSKQVDLDSSEGWGAMVESFDKSGWNDIVDGYVYFWGTWLTVALVILFSYSIAVYKRELALAKYAREGSGAAGSDEQKQEKPEEQNQKEQDPKQQDPNEQAPNE